MTHRPLLLAPVWRTSWAWLCVPPLLLLAACTPEPEHTTPLPSVYVTPVHHDNGEAQQRLSGTVAARIESELSFRVGGKIALRAVEVGQSVKQDQVLARLDEADLQLGVEVAAQQWHASQVDADQAASDAARFKRLLADGSVGAADLERQQARADAAQARLAQARGQLDLARRRLSYTTLSAPFDGVVTARRFETGQVVNDGQALLTLARPEALEVVVDVPESLAPDLRAYQASARLVAPSGAGADQPFTLSLRELAPAAQAATRTFRARYTVMPSTAPHAAVLTPLRLGNTVEVQLTRASGEASAPLPLSAVLVTTQSPTVWVVDAKTGSLTRQPVQVLSQTTETVRVRGLAEGALVVSVGAQKLDAAMHVRPVARPLAEAIQAPAITASGAAQ